MDELKYYQEREMFDWVLQRYHSYDMGASNLQLQGGYMKSLKTHMSSDNMRSNIVRMVMKKKGDQLKKGHYTVYDIE